MRRSSSLSISLLDERNERSHNVRRISVFNSLPTLHTERRLPAFTFVSYTSKMTRWEEKKEKKREGTCFVVAIFFWKEQVRKIAFRPLFSVLSCLKFIAWNWFNHRFIHRRTCQPGPARVSSINKLVAREVSDRRGLVCSFITSYSYQ